MPNRLLLCLSYLDLVGWYLSKSSNAFSNHAPWRCVGTSDLGWAKNASTLIPCTTARVLRPKRCQRRAAPILEGPLVDGEPTVMEVQVQVHTQCEPSSLADYGVLGARHLEN